jgi:ribose/xylose/arabinose/galactoside ABC-type transport system permease subunit
MVNNLVLISLLALLIIFFTAMNPRFFSNRNFIIVRQIPPVVLMGKKTFALTAG